MTQTPKNVTNANITDVQTESSGDIIHGDKVMLAPNAGDAVYGDKVMRDKYVTMIQSDVSLEQVKPVLLDIVHKLGEGEKEQAISSLATLNLMGHLNSETKVAIACLKSVSSLPLSDDEKKLIQYTYQENSNSDKEFQNFLNAAVINLVREQKSEQELRDFYQGLPIGTCTDIAYYRTLKQINSLDDISRELSSFSISALHLLLAKAFASGKFDICQQLFLQLKRKDFLADLSGQEVILQCLSINNFQVDYYLLLSTEQKQALDNVINTLIEYSDSQKALDQQYIGIAGQLLLYIQFSNSRLLKLVQDHRSLLNQVDFIDKEILVSFLDKDSLMQQPLPLKSAHDIALEIIQDVENGKFDIQKVLSLCEQRSAECIERTLSELLKLDRTIESLGCYCALATQAADFLDKKQFPSSEIETILTQDFKNRKLHLHFLIPTANLLSMAGYRGLALLALELLFKNTNPWLSDTYVQYLSLLYDNEQYNSLNSRLNSISDLEQSNSEVSSLKSCIATKENKFLEAVKLIEEQLKKYQDKSLSELEKRHCTHLWLNLLINLTNAKSSKLIGEYVKKIPITIFSNPEDELAWELLTFFGENYLEIEDMVLTWFFKDPNKYANQLFKIVMNISEISSNVGYNSKIFKVGYVYTENRQLKYRIVVDNQELSSQHPQYLIHSNTGLAQTLQSKTINTYFLYKTKHCSMKEQLPPIIAANRIAVEILDNDENQLFSRLFLPENPTPDDLFNLINSFVESSYDYTSVMKDYLKGNFPCIFKYKFIKSNNSYGQALISMLSDNVYMELYCENNISFDKSNSENIILDEVGFAFLAVSGLSNKIQGNIHITSETAKNIKEWCFTYGDMGIAFDSQKDDFIAVGAEDNIEQKLKLRDVTENLLSKCNVHNEYDYNVPLKLTIFANDLLTSSTKSSFGLAETKGFSYFTVDNQLRAFLSRPEFINVNVEPKNVQAFMFDNSDANAIGHFLRLSQHNFTLLLPAKAFDEVCIHGSEESVHNLAIYLQNIFNFDKKVIEYTIEKLVRNIFIKNLYGIEIKAMKSVFEVFFMKLFEQSDNPIDVANIFINIPPSTTFNAFKAEFLNKHTLNSIPKAMILTTEIIVSAYSNALKESTHNSAKVAKEIEALC